MKVRLTKTTEKGIERAEYIAHGVKYSEHLLALDIEGIGWRAFEYGKDYTSFAIAEK